MGLDLMPGTAGAMSQAADKLNTRVRFACSHSAHTKDVSTNGSEP